MVCIPCILIPAFLWFYYKFIRPYMGPVLKKLEDWLAPLKAKWCPQCSLTGHCPIKPSSKKTDGVVKERAQPDKPSPSAPIDDEEFEELDAEQHLDNVIQTGCFGTDVGELRRRPETTVATGEPTLVRSAV